MSTNYEFPHRTVFILLLYPISEPGFHLTLHSLKNLNLCSSLTGENRVSHPYKTVGNVIHHHFQHELYSFLLNYPFLNPLDVAGISIFSSRIQDLSVPVFCIPVPALVFCLLHPVYDLPSLILVVFSFTYKVWWKLCL